VHQKEEKKNSKEEGETSSAKALLNFPFRSACRKEKRIYQASIGGEVEPERKNVRENRAGGVRTGRGRGGDWIQAGVSMNRTYAEWS